jgi:signal peptidase II
MEAKAKHTPHSSRWHTIFWACFGGAMFLLDLLSKWIVQASCVPGVKNAIIPNFLYVTLSYNTKIAFSLGFDNVGGRILNILISLVMSGVIIAYFVVARDKLHPFMKAILALLGAGAVGNLIDRAFYWSGTTGFDGVIDFIQFYLGGGPDTGTTSWVNPFATFNWADSCLTIGVILFIVYLIMDTVKHPHEDPYEKDPRIKESTADSNPSRSNAIADKKADESLAKDQPVNEAKAKDQPAESPKDDKKE